MRPRKVLVPLLAAAAIIVAALLLSRPAPVAPPAPPLVQLEVGGYSATSSAPTLQPAYSTDLIRNYDGKGPVLIVVIPGADQTDCSIVVDGKVVVHQDVDPLTGVARCLWIPPDQWVLSAP